MPLSIQQQRRIALVNIKAMYDSGFSQYEIEDRLNDGYYDPQVQEAIAECLKRDELKHIFALIWNNNRLHRSTRGGM